MYKYIYGPVPSRRLGVSLGIDLVPYKVCSLDCVYCECGKTTEYTVERKEYMPIDAILTETREFLNNNPMPEWITLSGSGEPMLNSGAGRFINTIKEEYPTAKIAILTNGTLIEREDVCAEMMNADLVLPSLDSAMEKGFDKIDRPCGGISLPGLIKGLEKFTRKFQKMPGREVWIEVFFIDGINDTPEELNAFKEAINSIRPARVQLNTLDRPGTENWVKPMPHPKLDDIQKVLNILPGEVLVEVISKFKKREDIVAYRKNIEELVLETVSRRPCTARDIAEIAGSHINEINKYLEILGNEGRIKTEIKDRGIFFSLKR